MLKSTKDTFTHFNTKPRTTGCNSVKWKDGDCGNHVPKPTVSPVSYNHHGSLFWKEKCLDINIDVTQFEENNFLDRT